MRKTSLNLWEFAFWREMGWASLPYQIRLDA